MWQMGGTVRRITSLAARYLRLDLMELRLIGSGVVIGLMLWSPAMAAPRG